MTFTLQEQKRIGDQLEKCNKLFRMETDSNKSIGRLIVDVEDMLDCRGNYDIIVQVSNNLTKAIMN